MLHKEVQAAVQVRHNKAQALLWDKVYNQINLANQVIMDLVIQVVTQIQDHGLQAEAVVALVQLAVLPEILQGVAQQQVYLADKVVLVKHILLQTVQLQYSMQVAVAVRHREILPHQ